MDIYYLDSSAIVKRYIDEPGSTWIRQLCDAHETENDERQNLLAIGDITVAEVAAAFAILVRRRVISHRIAELAYRRFIAEFRTEYDLVNITPQLILNAAELTQRHPLKAYDAIQLALALNANQSLQPDEMRLTFVTGDNALLQAARAEGLATDNPFQHTALDKEQDSPSQ